MPDFETIGFVGVGVMGGAMSANLKRKSDARVLAFDISKAALERAEQNGVEAIGSLGELLEEAELVLLSLPGSAEVEEVCLSPGGILAGLGSHQVIADLSTTSVATARKVGAAMAEAGIRFADAPVTRTAQAALEGTLSFFVGGEAEVFEALLPVFAHMGTDYSHCGPVGSGQVVKLVNNMVCAQTVVALAEALAMAERAGVDGETLFGALKTGSAESFALNSHGLKSLAPRTYPTGKYSTLYALKDMGYALELAADTGVRARGAEGAYKVLEETRDAGYAEHYYPALLEVVDGGE